MNLKRTLTVATMAGSLLITGGSLHAASPQTRPAVRQDVPADLARQARISLETARATALAKVPHGEVRSEELEREHGKLIYSFDIAVPGKSGIEEVNVSAITGKILAKHHETAKEESKEAAKEHHPSGR
jgi:uncharacterized membrane protein YkoI